MRGPVAPLSFITNHPLNRGHRLASLERYLRWQIGARLVSGPIVVPLVDEAVLLARPGLKGATGVVYVGLPELESMAFVLHALRPGDLLVDVGANVGVYTLLAAAVVGAKVIAFEPDTTALDWLGRNIRLNGVSERVRVMAAAVGSMPGSIRMTAGLDTTNHVLSAHEASHASGDARDVVQISLDEVLVGETLPTIIKIDVEGYEASVVEGAQLTLQNAGVQAVIMELIGEGARYGADEGALASRMLRWGYARCRYDPMRRHLSELKRDEMPSGNTIFVRDVVAMAARVAQARSFRVMDHDL